MIRLGILLRVLLAGTALTGLSVLAWTTLADLRQPSFEGPSALADAIAAAAAWALQGCLAWLCLLLLAVVAETGATPARSDAPAPWSDRLGCPPAVRRAILAGCGLSVLVGAGPAYADQTPPEPTSAVDLTGLALPDRTATPAPTAAPAARERTTPAPTPAPDATPPRARPAPADDEVVVRTGDTLWALARDRLPSGSGDAAVAAAIQRWQVANRSTLTDPDLIHPGQHLRVPAGSEKEESR